MPLNSTEILINYPNQSLLGFARFPVNIGNKLVPIYTDAASRISNFSYLYTSHTI